MIFITGDIHGHMDIRKLNSKNFPEGNSLTKEDYVIICGDFGCVWKNDNQDKYWQKWLDNKPWTTLFCDGNHENFNLLNEYPEEEMFGGKVHRIKDSVFHLMRGYVFTIEDKSFFVMGGAASTDKVYRKENVSWWEQEIPTKEEFERGFMNLDEVNWKVNHVISHTGPDSIIKIAMYTVRIDDVSRYLEVVKDNLTFDSWYFGHMHLDMTIDKYNFMYNKIKRIL